MTLTTAVAGALGIAAWSKLIAKNDNRISLLYFVSMFLLLLTIDAIIPKKRDE